MHEIYICTFVKYYMKLFRIASCGAKYDCTQRYRVFRGNLICLTNFVCVVAYCPFVSIITS